jgi:hypothetical protein
MLRPVIAAIAIVPCLVVLLPAMAAALALRAFVWIVRALARRLEPAFMDWTELIEFDRTLGWKPRPQLNGHYLALGDDVFRLVTDREGWPGVRSLDESDIVAIGDSFTFGYGVDAQHSFAALDPQLPVKGIGAPGYSMVHGVLLMEQFARRLSGKLVVWFVYPENDLQDNLAPEMRQYRAPFVRHDRRRGGWDIVASHVEPSKFECSYLDARRLFPRFCIPGPLADRAYDACDYLIARAQAACRLAGAHLVVLTVPDARQLTAHGRSTLARLGGDPDRCDPDLADQRIAESCRRHDVPVVLGREHLSHADYKRREGIHWNRRGHRRIAALLAQLHASMRAEVRSSSLLGRRSDRHPVPERAPAATANATGLLSSSSYE